jgi:DNA damage-inducible protein 1
LAHFNVEVNEFVSLCALVLFLASQIMILFNSRPLTDDKKTLNQYGIRDGDLVTLQHTSAAAAGPASSARPPGIGGLDFSSIQVPQSSSGPNTPSHRMPTFNDDPAMIRDMLLANPDQLAMLQQNNPALGKS